MNPAVRTVMFSRSYATESKVVFAAFTTVPTGIRKRDIDTCIRALIACGVWPLLDVLWVMAAADSQAARVNWKNPGAFTLSPQNSPAFEADRGYTSDGSSSYLDTGYSPASGTQYLQDSAHLAVWSRTNSASTTVPIGGRDGATTRQSLIIPRNASDAVAQRVNQNASIGTGTGTTTNSSGHFIVARSASTAVKTTRNGVSIGTDDVTSTTRTNSTIFIGALNTATVPGIYSPYQLASASAGANFTDQQRLDYYTALQAYMTAVGA